MKLSGITFRAAYLCHQLDGEKVRYEKLPSCPEDKGEGVYVVTESNKVVYVGSYQSGVAKRWVYVKSKILYHFKDKSIAQSIRAGHKVGVWAATIDDVRSQIDCIGNPWVNAAGVEAHLISSHRPSWNAKGKRRGAV